MGCRSGEWVVRLYYKEYGSTLISILFAENKVPPPGKSPQGNQPSFPPGKPAFPPDERRKNCSITTSGTHNQITAVQLIDRTVLPALLRRGVMSSAQQTRGSSPREHLGCVGAGLACIQSMFRSQVRIALCTLSDFVGTLTIPSPPTDGVVQFCSICRVGPARGE